MSATWPQGEQQGAPPVPPQPWSQQAPPQQPARQPLWHQRTWSEAPPMPHQAPPPAASAAPQWSSPSHPGPRTDLLAVLAILAAVAGVTLLPGIGSLAALVLGPIALGRIRRSGDDGRLLAIAAIVLAVVSLVAGIAMVAVGFSFLLSMIESLAPTFAP